MKMTDWKSSSPQSVCLPQEDRSREVKGTSGKTEGRPVSGTGAR